jgi:hypothetical protein
MLSFLSMTVIGASAQSVEQPKQIRLMAVPSAAGAVKSSGPTYSFKSAVSDKTPILQSTTKSSDDESGRGQTFGKARMQDWFEITTEDETLYLALRRWAAETGYQLVWDAGKDFPVKNTVYVTDDIVQAISQVMADTEASSYPLHACTYNNKVIRILHVSQSCERK